MKYPPIPPPPQQNSSSPAPRSSNTTSTPGLFFFGGLAGGFGLATGATGTTGTTGASDGIVTTAEHDGHFARVPPSWSGTCDVKPQCGQVNGKGMLRSPRDPGCGPYYSGPRLGSAPP